MAEFPDAQTQLKKRARRRLMGAIALAGLAAVVLPMVMDEEPKQQVQDVQIRIPGQEQLPFKPGISSNKSTSAAPLVAPAPDSVVPEKSLAAPRLDSPASSSPSVEGASVRSAEKTSERTTEKKVEKPSEKSSEKPVKPPVDDAKRAIAILAGKAPEPAAVNVGAQYVILIGAFSNTANVKLLESKIGEMGIKTFTESLDSPEGRKTRLRAGPFSSRDQADKAVEKMKRIGISGVVAAK
jgi:DedD protein